MFKSSYTQNASVLLHESMIVFRANPMDVLYLEVGIFEVGSSVFLLKAAYYEALKMRK